MKSSSELMEKNIRLIGADPLTQRGFTQVPNAILKSKDISAGAKLTYAMLLSYAMNKDECFPGQDRLATDMAISRQTVNGYIKELQKKASSMSSDRGKESRTYMKSI